MDFPWILDSLGGWLTDPADGILDVLAGVLRNPKGSRVEICSQAMQEAIIGFSVSRNDESNDERCG